MMLSRLVEAIRVPSGLYATRWNEALVPGRVRMISPVRASRIITFPSSPTEAIRVPSGLNAASKTLVVWPVSVRRSARRSRVR
jgi:hypothetical protein